MTLWSLPALNPDIKDHGKNTRFGKPGGADPKRARELVKVDHSLIKRHLRRLMVFPLDPNLPISPQIESKKLLKFLSRGCDGPTVGMLTAVDMLRHAFKDGRSILKLVDIIDGKVGKAKKSNFKD